MRVLWKLLSFVTWKIETMVEKNSKTVKRACSFIRELRVAVQILSRHSIFLASSMTQPCIPSVQARWNDYKFGWDHKFQSNHCHKKGANVHFIKNHYIWRIFSKKTVLWETFFFSKSWLGKIPTIIIFSTGPYPCPWWSTLLKQKNMYSLCQDWLFE